MKNYNQVAEDVLRRRDEYVAERRKQIKMVRRATSVVCCLSLVVLIGVGVSKSGLFNKVPETNIDDSIQIGEKDVIHDENNGENIEDVINPTTEHTTESTMGSDRIIVGGSLEGASACYRLPEAGEYNCFIEVNEAREFYYDEDVKYLLRVEIFSGINHLDGEEFTTEYDRLLEKGYELYYNVLDLEGGEEQHIIIGCFTESQLESFSVNEQYGYIFRFAQIGDDSQLELDGDVITWFEGKTE